jgi:hypothetical protein
MLVRSTHPRATIVVYVNDAIKKNSARHTNEVRTSIVKRCIFCIQRHVSNDGRHTEDTKRRIRMSTRDRL